MSSLAIMLAVGPAKADLLTVDQIIFESGTGQNINLMSGTIDYTASGNTATIVLTNTSDDGAFPNNVDPSKMLLTGFGLQLPGVNIVSGSVSVTAGSQALNFDAGQSLTNISNQYAFANQAINGYNGISGVLPVDSVVTSVNNGAATRFAGPPPTTIDGPDYGALSNSETGFGSSTPGVRNSVTVVLNFGIGATAPTFTQVNSGNVVLAFGSPDTLNSTPHVPDNGSTVALLGFTLLGVEFLRRKISKNRLALN